MIWIFLALIIAAVFLYQVFKNAKVDARVAEVNREHVEWENRNYNQKIRDMMKDCSVGSLISVIQRAEHQAELSKGTFSLEPDVERAIQLKVKDQKEKEQHDVRLADAICLAYENQTAYVDFDSSNEAASGTPFQASLRNIAETGLQNRGAMHLNTLKKLAQEAHRESKQALREEAQKKGTALPAGATLFAKINLPMPTALKEKELFELMQFVGFKQEKYDLIERYWPGDLLVWRHKNLLDVYISLIQAECAPDGIQVSYEAQMQIGSDGVPVTVSLPYRLPKESKPYIWANVLLCVSCEV